MTQLLEKPHNRTNIRKLPVAAEPYKFQPGISPNPSGRPKSTPELTKAAQVLTLECLETLACIMRDEKAKNRDRIDAASKILDRGHGKAEGKVSVDVSGSVRTVFDSMLPDQLEAMRVLLQAAQERSVLPPPDAVDAEIVDPPEEDIPQDTPIDASFD